MAIEYTPPVNNFEEVDQIIRQVQDCFQLYRGPYVILGSESIKPSILYVCERKKEYDAKNIYTPSALKITVAMLQRGIGFEEALEFLHAHEENIARIFKE